MANLSTSVPENVPGDFFVDTTCIDCDTCRQLAPASFAEGPGQRVKLPEGEMRRQLEELVTRMQYTGR